MDRQSGKHTQTNHKGKVLAQGQMVQYTVIVKYSNSHTEVVNGDVIDDVVEIKPWAVFLAGLYGKAADCERTGRR